MRHGGQREFGHDEARTFRPRGFGGEGRRRGGVRAVSDVEDVVVPGWVGVGHGRSMEGGATSFLHSMPLLSAFTDFLSPLIRLLMSLSEVAR